MLGDRYKPVVYICVCVCVYVCEVQVGSMDEWMRITVYREMYPPRWTRCHDSYFLFGSL